MKRLVSLIVLSVLFIGPARTVASSREVERVDDAIEVLRDITAIPEKGIPPALLKNSYAIAIVPNLIKAGFVIGGRHGRGVLVVRKGGNSWSDPVFIALTGGSIGWQIGAQAIDVILVFKSKRSIDNIVKGKFTLGGDASIAAGPVGRQAGAGTDITFKSEIYSYSRSRGLFAGISLEGSSLRVDNDANGAFYGREDLYAGDILKGKVRAPSVVKELKKALAQSTSKK
jgi:lipid-binding SYLF domain-containing protein